MPRRLRQPTSAACELTGRAALGPARQGQRADGVRRTPIAPRPSCAASGCWKTSSALRRRRRRPTCRRSRRSTPKKVMTLHGRSSKRTAPTRHAPGCHATMDPIGFALEHFDATGAWRDYEKGMGSTPIDAAASSQMGRSLRAPSSFARSIMGEPEAFVSTVVQKLISLQALGRGLGGRDMAAVRSIVRDTADDDYRFFVSGDGDRRERAVPMRKAPIEDVVASVQRRRVNELSDWKKLVAPPRSCAASAPPSHYRCSMRCCRPRALSRRTPWRPSGSAPSSFRTASAPDFGRPTRSAPASSRR